MYPDIEAGLSDWKGLLFCDKPFVRAQAIL